MKLLTYLFSCIFFTSYSQDTLSKNDFPYLSQSEFDFAKNKDKYSINHSKFEWKEWTSESYRTIKVIYKEAIVTKNIDGWLLFDSDTLRIFGKNLSAGLWKENELVGVIYFHLESKNNPNKFLASTNIEGKKVKVEVEKTEQFIYSKAELATIYSKVIDTVKNKEFQFIEDNKAYFSTKIAFNVPRNKMISNKKYVSEGSLFLSNKRYDIKGNIEKRKGNFDFCYSVWYDSVFIGILKWIETETNYMEVIFKITNDEYPLKSSLKSYYVIFTESVDSNLYLNPFGNGGKGSGKGVGADVPNNNLSNESIKKRTLISKPNSTTLNSEEDCIIHLKLQIDELGEIIGLPKVDYEITTTKDTVLINQVVELVKAQSKWNASPGAAIFKTGITIKIKGKPKE